MEKPKDQDRGKGAMEEDKQSQGGNTSMQGQLGHRDGTAVPSPNYGGCRDGTKPGNQYVEYGAGH